MNRFKVGDKVVITRLTLYAHPIYTSKWKSFIGTKHTVVHIYENGEYKLNMPDCYIWKDDELELDKSAIVLDIIKGL